MGPWKPMEDCDLGIPIDGFLPTCKAQPKFGCGNFHDRLNRTKRLMACKFLFSALFVFVISEEMARYCMIPKATGELFAGLAFEPHLRVKPGFSLCSDGQISRCLVSRHRSSSAYFRFSFLGPSLVIDRSTIYTKDIRRSFSTKCAAQAATCKQAEDKHFWADGGLQNCTLYDFLGLPRDASPKHIKAAYRKSVKLWHPDIAVKDKLEKYTEEFLKIHDAYIILSNPETRARYDEQLRLKSLQGRKIKNKFPGITSFDQNSEAKTTENYCFGKGYRFTTAWRSNWETDQCWSSQSILPRYNQFAKGQPLHLTTNRKVQSANGKANLQNELICFRFSDAVLVRLHCPQVQNALESA
eukprot:Gb_09519 [translate_table: standard]